MQIGALLEGWKPALGKPSCGPGCDRCCRRMSVLMTSAEATRLVDALRRRPDFDALRAKITARAAELERALPASPQAALDALLDLGPCVFLEDRKCSVYPARPDGCRAAFVWHEPWYCGRPQYDQCVPAELNAERVEQVYRLLLAELDAGRRPYIAQILPAAWLMLEHGAAYGAGADLAERIDPAWIAAELVEFPAREQAIRERDQHRAIFRDEPDPLGSPRASQCRSRDELRAFRTD